MTPAPQSVLRWLPTIALVLALTLVAALLGWKSLVDPDLGWHLAGGLWMFEHHRVPTRDPFGAEGSRWLAYSWLFEVAIAAVFRAGGFGALQLLQCLYISLSTLAILVLVIHTCASTIRTWEKRDFALLVVIAVLLIFFISPVWQLRPQLFSLVLFSVLLKLLSREKLNLVKAVALCVVWAQVHVYWVFVPGLWILKKLSVRNVRGLFEALLLVGCGALSPYGLENILGIVPYVLNHEAANEIIREFQPPGLGDGYILPLIVLTASWCFASWRKIAPNQVWLLATTAVFLFLSLRQIKYTPLFGIAALTLIGMREFAKERPVAAAMPSGIPRKGRLAFACFLSGVLIALVIATTESPSPLADETAELIELGPRFRAALPNGGTVVNHLDNGGWLALSLWLSRNAGESESRIKTSFDGRTLVMGEERLRKFKRWQQGELSPPDLANEPRVELRESKAPERPYWEIAVVTSRVGQ